MRIALVQEEIDVRRGGAETSTLEMARHLARLGLDVTILCRAGTLPAGEPNVRLLNLAAGGRTRAGRTFRFVRAVHAVCRGPLFDVVHAITPCLCADVYQPRGGTYPATIARSLALAPAPLRPLKRLGRRFNIRQQFLRRIEASLLAKRNRRVVVAAVSEYVRGQVLALGVAPERVRVVFNGVDIAPLEEAERAALRATLRDRLGVADATPLVLLVAHNFRLKGVPELLRAAATVRDAAWHVVIAGRDRAAPVQRLARRLELGGRVHLVGTGVSAREWYAAADVLAHPTWHDPCSRVVLEALSVGLPVVTTRYNGAAEALTPGRHGFILDEPRDAVGLAAAIARCFEPALQTACRADALLLHARLSMNRHARELAALYEGLSRSDLRVPGALA